jgi:hypothetical protein
MIGKSTLDYNNKAKRKDEVEMNLVEELTKELLEAYEIGLRDLNYDAKYLLKMLKENKNGVAVAKALIAKKPAPEGFRRLIIENRLELTVEAIVVKEKYKSLFSKKEILKSMKRLEKHGYRPPAPMVKLPTEYQCCEKSVSVL